MKGERSIDVVSAAKGSRGFTLIELLIVVVVIATLMGLVFRLAGIGGGQSARNSTITRIQKLEFALSGYYAAFGSYPPVPLHGSRDIRCKVNAYGIQDVNSDRDARDLSDIWPLVRAACLSQPIACEYPYNVQCERVKNTLEMQNEIYSSDGKYASAPYNAGNIALEPKANSLKNSRVSDWSQVQIFKFGVLSFLLPRYLFMLQGDSELYKVGGTYSAQWRSQNDIRQLLDFETGAPCYNDWSEVQSDTGQHRDSDNDTSLKSSQGYMRVARQSSQAVCARWIQALDGIVSGGQVFYGVNTRLDHDNDKDYFWRPQNQTDQGMLESIYSASGEYSGSGQSYYLDGMTVRDGWGNDLFYYSPPPYQGYQIWSAGPNKKTVPPWVDVSAMGATDRKTAADWLSDDVVGLSTPAN